MKYTIFLIALLFVFDIAIAQSGSLQSENNNYRTLFGSANGSTKVSGFGSFNLDFGNIDNEFGLMIGGEGAVLINRSFFIGFYGRALATAPKYSFTYYNSSDNTEITVDRNVAFGHGGLLVGAIFNATKPMHFGISIRIGGGGVSLFKPYSDEDYYSSHKDFYEYPHIAPIFVMSPQLDFEMNLTNWMKFKVSAGYQYVANASLNYKIMEDGNIVDKELLNTSIFNTPTVSMGFIFGWFK